MTTKRTHRFLAPAFAGLLVLGAGACGDDDNGDNDLGDDLTDTVDDVGDDVTDTFDDATDELDEQLGDDDE